MTSFQYQFIVCVAFCVVWYLLVKHEAKDAINKHKEHR